MHSDDTSVSFSPNSIPVINDRVIEDQHSLKTQLAANKLSLNVDKTHSLIIGSGQKLKRIRQTMAMKPSLVIGRETISMIKDTKQLWVSTLINITLGCTDTNMIKKCQRRWECCAVPNIPPNKVRLNNA